MLNFDEIKITASSADWVVAVKARLSFFLMFHFLNTLILCQGNLSPLMAINSFFLYSMASIFFLNNDFKTIDALKLATEKFDSNWVLPSKSLSEAVAKNMSDFNLYWGLLTKSNSSKIARIEYVAFIDSTNLFVRWYNYDTINKFMKRFTMNLIKSDDSWIAVQANTQAETPLHFNTNLNIFAVGMPLLSDIHLTAYTENFIYQVRIDIPYIENLSYRKYFLKKMEKKTLDPVISLWVFKYD